MIIQERHTLGQCLADGTLQGQDALQLAASLAEALRKIHDEGRVHGALTPSIIGITETGLDLVPGGSQSVTPYTAPEVLRGRRADWRSDIFSFGAIVYEMITGHPPFAGDTPEALADAVLHTPAPPIGGAVDVLLVNCLAKDPAVRWTRMHRVQIELKLLRVSARCKEASGQRETIAAMVRAEVQHVMAAQIGTCLETQNKAITDFQQTTSASLQALEAHLQTVDAKLEGTQESASRAEGVLPQLALRLTSLEEREGGIERISDLEVQLQTAADRITQSEQIIESVRRQATDWAENVASQLRPLGQVIQSHAEALELARTAQTQTEDMVERVVEALESLQSLVLENHGSDAAGQR